MAALGLSRIANSLVGDASRRGVSGGEKKRVNIGVELMKQPRILFLDEVRILVLGCLPISENTLHLLHVVIFVANQRFRFSKRVCCDGKPSSFMSTRNDSW